MNYYIADLHLGHDNIIHISGRPFADADEMDNCLMDAWNARVTNKDDIFIVGDLIYRNSKDFKTYLDKLSGHKHLIIGNHDDKLIKDPDAVNMLDSVDKYLEIKDGEYKLFLCHYPVAEWPGYHSGWKHFFGHIHNNVSAVSEFMKTSGNAYNIGVDVIGPMPLTAKEIVSGYSTSWNV